MLRDVFYYGNKPNVHPREKPANNLEDARSQCTTEHFWIINELCDYRGFDWDFDFEFLPDEDVWTEEHNNVWPSQHQKDSGTWLCAKKESSVIVYRGDVDPVKRKNELNNNWFVPKNIVTSDFDFSWHPDPTDPAYIYEFPTVWNDRGGPKYFVEGATEYKYINNYIAKTKDDRTSWDIPANIDLDSFDFTWVPHPDDPPMIYQFGTQWQKTGGPRYVVENAIEVKYVMMQVAKRLPSHDNWNIPENVDVSNFDFSWHPDDTEPAYVYQFGTQWANTGGPTYIVEKDTEVKYIDSPRAIALPVASRWIVPEYIDTESFDFSWHPAVEDQPYIYQFGTQHQKTGGPQYIAQGIVILANGKPLGPVKYIDPELLRATALPRPEKFAVLNKYKVENFDYSWHPDDTEQKYVYQFGNTQYPPEVMPTVQYAEEGAEQVKYVNDIVATLAQDSERWFIPEQLDVTDFDFSWKPNPKDPAYIYQFGTQHQKTGGPRYVVSDATETKFIDTQIAKRLPSRKNWIVPNNIDTSEFDFSWHPDDTSPPYVYNFATQWALSGGPVYMVEGASEVKYIETQVARALPSKANWEIPDTIDVESFDFSWHPYVEDQPYIYQFGTQHQKTGGPRYITPGAFKNSPVKYIDPRVLKATRLPSKKNWRLINNYKIADFDYSWHPDETDEEQYIYIFGNNFYSAEIMPTLEYYVPGASKPKYVNDIIATLGADKTFWEVPKNVDVTDFDFSWKPNPHDPPFIYQFGTQWQKTGGPRYNVMDATEIKYIEGSKARALDRPSDPNWQLPENINISEFDYSWHPDDTENIPYIYVFGTQWALSGGPKYVVPGASVVKYIEEPIAKAAPNRANWVIPDDIDVESFDFSWHPYAEDEPYIYQFGTQWQASGGPKYIAPECDDMSPIKYIDTRVLKAKKLPNFTNWEIPVNVDRESFDFSWQPGVEDKPYIYEFGTQWQKTGGPRYVMPGAVDIKFVDAQKATVLPDRTNWVIPKDVNVSTFDFSWHPDSTAPKYVYQFGTITDPNDGPRYLVPGNDGEMINLERVETESTELVCSRYVIETTLEDLIEKHPTELFWALNSDLDYAEFDFSWRPSIEQANYVHAFGSEDNINTQTYFVNAVSYNKGFTEINYVEGKMEVKTKIDMYFVDRGNSEVKERFEKLKQQFPDIQKTRYLNSWVDTINRCINRSTTKLCWILNSELDYDGFDFNYYPNPWQMKMVQVFGTQWSHWGTTFMVNRETFAEDTKYIKIIEHLSNLNFVKDRRAKATNVLYDIVYIDHGNLSASDFNDIECEGRLIVKYQDSYLNTFKNMLTKLPAKKEHYVWVTSTICEYFGFDFTYICDPFAREQLHVFPSDKQKFGDTFLVNVNKLRELIHDMEQLEDYEKINYNQSQRTKRLPAPIIVTEGDTHVASIDAEFDFPYATFVSEADKDIQVIDTEPMSLWSPETKNIIITSTGGTRITVPKEAKEQVKRELYDYPYIITNSKLALSKPMDIVFLSNGETGADENYEHLLRTTHGLSNRVTRVDGVNGRVAAYHAAANASNTPWMFTVFAKLKVSNKFDWNWQPDRLQIPKHYVFHAKNPVNGLVYGHQAMIAYNKKLTLNNEGKGLDFTMDDEHEIVELLSGTANFNTDAWSTWRTSFREALKLRANTDDVSKSRLEFWLTVGSGKFNEYSTDGAQHAIDYYNSVNGDFEQLKLSYEWEWLRNKFDSYYK